MQRMLYGEAIALGKRKQTSLIRIQEMVHILGNTF